jgi:ABC-2 type transport system permease protein
VAVNMANNKKREEIQHFKALLWLKWKLGLRGYTRNKSALWATIVALLFSILPLLTAITGGVGYALWRFGGDFIGVQALRGTLGGIYLLWVFAPLLGFAVNDAYDVTKLFVYPISVRRLFVGTLLGSLLDQQTLLLLPVFIAILVGLFHHSLAAFLWALIVLPLFLFHTLALSQGIVLATQGILKSRKFRERAMILVVLFWMTYAVGWQVFSRNIGRYDWRAFFHSTPWEVLNFLPPGLAARSLTHLLHEEWGAAFGYALLLFLCTIGTIQWASVWLEKVYRADDASDGVSGADTSTKILGVSAQIEGGVWRFLSPISREMIQKEWLYYRRDPQFKIVLMNYVYMIFIGMFMSFMRSKGQSNMPFVSITSLWFVSNMLLFLQTMLCYNIFGTEGNGVITLFSLPTSRRAIIIGKNVAMALPNILLNVMVMLILCGVSKHLELAWQFGLWVLLATVMMTSVGNVASILSPFRPQMKGFKTQQNSGPGLIYLGFTLLGLAFYVPIFAGIFAPPFFHAYKWCFLTVPLAFCYVGFIYWLSLRIAEALLPTREEKIIAKISRPDA